MKNIKTIALIISIMFLISKVHAQTFGIKGGFNLSNITLKNVPFDYQFTGIQPIPGFHFGTFAEFRISNHFFIESDLLLTTKGHKYKLRAGWGGFSYMTDDILRLMYLDIPVMGKVKYKVGKVKLYGMAGPYLGIGIAGNIDYKRGYDYSITGTKRVIWGNNPRFHDFSRIDYGLAFGTGIEFKRYMLGVNYHYGFKDITVHDLYEMYSRVFNVSIGYKFGNQKSINPEF